ncbi:unnamed protein product [Colias eurytheme]|nr:unnamed protein product [Colias eurytheme]
MSRGDIHCVPSYNFIEADLRSIVRPVDSSGAAWCACVCACVGGACFAGRRNLPADGARIMTISLATQRRRKLSNDERSFSFILAFKTLPYSLDLSRNTLGLYVTSLDCSHKTKPLAIINCLRYENDVFTRLNCFPAQLRLSFYAHWLAVMVQSINPSKFQVKT